MIAEIVYHMISMICMSEGDSTDKGLFSAAILAIVCDSVNLFGYVLVLFCSHRATRTCKDSNQGGASLLYVTIIFSWFLYAGSISSAVSFFEEDEIFPYNNGEWTSGMVLLLYVNHHIPQILRMSLYPSLVSYKNRFCYSLKSLLRYTLECYEILNSRFALEHRYFTIRQLLPKDFVFVMIGADACGSFSFILLFESFDSNDDLNNRYSVSLVLHICLWSRSIIRNYEKTAHWVLFRSFTITALVLTIASGITFGESEFEMMFREIPDGFQREISKLDS